MYTDPLAEQEPWLDGENEISARVTQMTWESDSVVSVRLESTEGHPMPAWAPGAHIDLNLTSSLVRQYSLCGVPQDRGCYTVAVLREKAGRGGSAYVHDTLRVGQELRVVGPRNNFALDEAPRYLFIAGGIGITPLLPMIRSVEASGAQWRLLYGGSRHRGMAFLRDVAQWDGKVEVLPDDEGRHLDLAAAVAGLSDGELIYACGPAPMLEALEELCADLPPGVLHLERFMPKRREDTADTDETIEVECRDSGLTLQVPADESILEAMEKAGIDWPSSCRDGVCGTCECPILEGVADHRDSLLSPDEQEANETLMVCVSRAKTPRLVLEA